MSDIYQSREIADAITEKLRIYAQPQRLMILSYLLQGEKTVSDIDAATGIGQPALSQQLAELRRAEVVKTRRVAKQVYYDLNDNLTALCLRSMEVIFGNDEQEPIASLQQILDSNITNKSPQPRISGAAAFAKIG